MTSLLNDRYELKEELGRGGMGIVYAAEDRLLAREVAVKVLLTAGLGTLGRTRLLQEARATAGLNHPNIVAVYDVGLIEDPGVIEKIGYIVMERVRGDTLADYKPDSLVEIYELGEQICSALDHAHQHGVLHRDLKPENIAVGLNKVVKLMDFGLAKTNADASLEQSAGISGSLPYIAPEVILGEPSSAQADLFALGVVLYELVSGRNPFEGPELAAVLSQMLHGPVIPPSTYDDSLPAAFEALILRLLSKRPEDRPGSAAEVGELFTGWLSSGQGLLVEPGLRISGLDRLVRGRLIGRKTELQRLATTWRQMMGGQGQFCLISGESGIGKTRLARELTSYANISGGQAYTAECFAEGGRPYLPFAEIITTAISRSPDLKLPAGVLSDLLALAPELRLHYPEIAVETPAETGVEQQNLFESVVLLLKTVIAAKPLLLFVDDLHWADSGSLALLTYLARRSRQSRLMIVGTYWESELSDQRPLKSVLTQLVNDRLAERIKLGRFDYWETQALLEIMLSSSISAEFVDQIYQETEGNPLYVEEVCKALIENGKLSFNAGQWRRTDEGKLELPQGIRLAIQARIDNLPDEAQQVLQLGAILGREFSYDLLRTISDLEEEQLISALEDAVQAQLIQEAGSIASYDLGNEWGKTEPAFRFNHALIHSTTLTGLGLLRRQRLQYRVATKLEEAYPEKRDALAATLGRFFAEAGAGDKAIHYLLTAGDAAQRLFAYKEASQAYEQALLFLDEQEGSNQAARTRMKLALTYHNSFQFEKARKTYEDAFNQWQIAPSTSTETMPLAERPLRTHLRELTTLDPAQSIHFVANQMILQLFSGLVELRPNHEIVPDVAKSWEMQQGGRRYVFYLRDDVFWSDGRPVTAGDFVYAWKRILAPKNSFYHASMLFDIRGARAYYESGTAGEEQLGLQAVDDRTLIIELERPTGYFLHLLSQFAGMPAPCQAIEQWGEAWIQPEHIVTNGPFRLRRWQADRLELTHNPDYHRPRRGNVQEIIIHFLEDAETAQRMYATDELDCLQVTPLISPEAHDRLRQRFPTEYVSGPMPSIRFLAFDVTRPPFADVRVRRAFALATDNHWLADEVLGGLYRPAEGGFVPPHVPGYSENLGLGYDSEQAAQLLAEAGYPGGRSFPPIVARMTGGDVYQTMAQALESAWRKTLGIEVRFQPMPPSKGSNIWLAGIAPEYPDPDSFLRLNNWGNVTGWTNELFDKLVNQARELNEWDQRLAMYRQAEALLIEEVGLLPLIYSRFHMLLKPRIKHYPLSPLTIPYWKDVVLEDMSSSL